jgi:flagellar motor switch/type III secretory pathway protein FliN
LDALSIFGGRTGLVPKHTATDGSGIGEQLIERAWLDLYKRLAQSVGALVNEPPHVASPLPELAAPFSGAVMAHLICADIPLVIALSGALLADLCPQSLQSHQVSAKLQSPQRALATLNVGVECSFGPTSVDLGTLASLNVGDVLLLDQLLHEPLFVTTTDGSHLCRAFLGKRGAFMALELTTSIPHANH